MLDELPLFASVEAIEAAIRKVEARARVGRCDSPRLLAMRVSAALDVAGRMANAGGWTLAELHPTAIWYDGGQVYRDEGPRTIVEAQQTSLVVRRAAPTTLRKEGQVHLFLNFRRT